MANLSITNTFTNGQTAEASQVNTNFSDISTYINQRNQASAAWNGFLLDANGTVQAASIGSNLRFRVNNSDNTSGLSNALILLDVGGTSGGDPLVNWSIPGTANFSAGIDNSDSDKFKIVRADTLGGATAAITIDDSNQVGINGAILSSRILSINAGTSDATSYSPLAVKYGGNSVQNNFNGQTTTGVTTTGSYILSNSDDALVIVNGNDATNYFRDIIGVSFNATVSVISSGTASASPSARTYVSDGTGLKLTMASGTYTVNAFSIQLGRR